MASICGSPVCAGGKPQLKFTYTGDYVVRTDGVVELLTSGTLVFLSMAVIDLFMVGGGGAGGGNYGSTSSFGVGGGGGGYTRTEKKMNVNDEYLITIGQGGAPLNNQTGSDGGTTSWGNITVSGGKGGTSGGTGGAGGSGGGGGVSSSTSGGDGGYNGGNGSAGFARGGAGQGSTTREFGETEGKLYAGGGGGGRYLDNSSGTGGMGGSGGGGTGGWVRNEYPNTYTAATAGVANTGGGGGGGASARWNSGATIQGAAGGSGIVCFREAQELPELAGTWVLNERMYAPVSNFTENVNFTFYTDTGASVPGNQIRVNDSQLYVTQTNVGEYQVYNFTSNSWQQKYKTWKFEVGTTASDEFRAWLASNATKQA
nr:MAG TPA: hypothetical protein [Caudoviricetes sp.]